MYFKRGAKDTRETVKHIDRKQTDNAMAKKKDEQTNNGTKVTTYKKTKD